MLYLLNKDVRTVRWNGEPLHEATSAIVKETMNGDFTLTVKYPISDSGIYQLIKEDMLIKAPTPVLGAQLFRIKKPVEHNDHLEITAYHISDDVAQRSITPVSVTSQSCSMALSRMVQNTKTALGDFSFNSDIQDRRTFNTTETETLYSVLLDGKHSIVGTWEGELVRDNFAMTVKKSRGENRGVVITTHKNLKDYQRTRNSQNVVTRIHAKSTFKPEGAEKETTIRVTVDSPLINSYPYINEKEYENNNAKTVEELQKWAQSKFSNEGIDKVSDAIKIEAFELDGQVVHMGDTVNLKSWKHNVDAFKKAIAYEFDALKEEYISLTFDDKAGTGGSRASGGLSSAADAILGVTESAQEIALEKALQNADLDFDHKAELLRQEIADGIELARAKAEEVKRELSDTIDQRFSSFDNGPLQEAKRRAEEALRNAGASTLLAQEAKRIGLDSIARLEAFKSQATSAQTALSGDLDALKRTVASEVNQASEYRRTTTEVISRMTGQMNGFATKSEVKQGIDGLTQTFAKMKVGGRNLWIKSKTVGAVIEKLPENHVTGQKECYRLENNSTLTFNLEPDFSSRLYQKVTYSAWIKFENVVQGQNSWNAFNCFKHYLFRKNSKTGIQNGPDYTTLGIYAGSSDWKYITFTYDYSENQNFDQLKTSLRFNLEGATSGTAWVTGIKVEIGSVATDYSPALEDEEAELLVAKTEFKKTADGLSAKMSAVESYVGQDSQRQEALQRYTREESARQATAVRELVNRDFVGKATYQEDVRGLERRFSAISTQTNNDIAAKIAQYKQTVDGKFANITSQIANKANQTDFQRVQETSRLYERIIGNTENGIADKVARMAMTSQLFQVEVAKNASNGQNLLKGTKVFSGDWKNMAAGWKKHSNKYQGCDVLFKNNSWNGIGQELDANIGEIYTFSLWMKSDWKNDTVNFYVNRNGSVEKGWGVPSETSVAITHEWKRYSFTFKITADGFIFPRVERLNQNTNLYVAGLKLEKGSYATPYTEAPEDTDEAIRTVQSQLAGSWGVHNKNSVNEIIAGFNLAGRNAGIKAETIRLEGRTLLDELTAIQGYFKRLFVGEGTFATLNTDILRANSITADKLIFDQAMANKFTANNLLADSLFSKQAFINRVQSVAIDASQVRSGILSGDRIYGGTIRGANIFGGTLTGHTKIQLGSYGSFDALDGGLQINVPRDYNAKDGLGVQFIGSYGRGENVPYGLFIYKDSDFTTGGYASQSDEFLLTVEGYINAKGIGWLKTGKGNINGKTTATIGLWNSENVSLDFGGSGNDIYYSYNGTAYSLWSVVKQHFSDRRLKDNVVDCKHKALDYIQQFKFKEYDWKKQEDRPQQAHTKIGLIAQEVQAVDPTLVYENGDTLNLDNLRLTNIALKAIQELALENQKLTHRLENLENERRTA